jgi:hypothetical protein
MNIERYIDPPEIFYGLDQLSQNEQLYVRCYKYLNKCRVAELGAKGDKGNKADRLWVGFDRVADSINIRINEPQQILLIASRFLNIKTNPWCEQVGLVLLHTEKVIEYVSQSDEAFQACVDWCYPFLTNDRLPPRSPQRYNFIQANETLLCLMDYAKQQDNFKRTLKLGDVISQELTPQHKQILAEEASKPDMKGTAIQRYYGSRII